MLQKIALVGFQPGLRAAIPEGEFSAHYFYRSARNYDDTAMNKMFTDAVDFLFGQDKPI